MLPRASLSGPNYANGMIKCNLPNILSHKARWTFNSSPSITLNCPYVWFNQSVLRLGIRHKVLCSVVLHDGRALQI